MILPTRSGGSHRSRDDLLSSEARSWTLRSRPFCLPYHSRRHAKPDPASGSGISRGVRSALPRADPAARTTEADVREPASWVGIRAHGHLVLARSPGRLRSSPRAAPQLLVRTRAGGL